MPTSQPTASLRLPHELTIYTATETRTAWLAWLAGDGVHSAGDAVCRVDGEDVDEVDAAGVQLLVALANSLQRQQVTLQLQHASRPLRNACHDLGLAGLLLGADDPGTAPAGACA
jgi:ABC-type transporter Mla MlaB component